MSVQLEPAAKRGAALASSKPGDIGRPATRPSRYTIACNLAFLPMSSPDYVTVTE